MAKAVRKCKICGKEYEYCHTVGMSDAFRWQDVACCPEHGSDYFAKVLAARSGKTLKKRPKDTLKAAESAVDDTKAENIEKNPENL